MERVTTGTVVSVASSEQRGIPKQPRQRVEIGSQGVVGDFHAGPVNRHKKVAPEEPNWRAVTVLAWETFQALNLELGINLKPGDFAENVLLRGHGDLSELVEGDEIRLGHAVVLRVSKQNKPCATLTSHHPDIVKHALGRRGIAATVVRTGAVRPGDRSAVVRRAAAPSGVPDGTGGA